MIDVGSLVAGLSLVNLFASTSSNCSCWQSVFLAGLLGLWCGLLLGILLTIFLCSPSLRQACQRAFRAFWYPVGQVNHQQAWRGGVDLARYHLD